MNWDIFNADNFVRFVKYISAVGKKNYIYPFVNGFRFRILIMLYIRIWWNLTMLERENRGKKCVIHSMLCLMNKSFQADRILAVRSGHRDTCLLCTMFRCSMWTVHNSLRYAWIRYIQYACRECAEYEEHIVCSHASLLWSKILLNSCCELKFFKLKLLPTFSMHLLCVCECLCVAQPNMLLMKTNMRTISSIPERYFDVDRVYYTYTIWCYDYYYYYYCSGWWVWVWV